MAAAALILAALALIVALVALARAAGQSAKIEEARQSTRRGLSNLAEEREHREANLRMVVAALAGGQELSRQQVLEGILWSDVDDANGQKLVASGEVRVLDVRSPDEVATGAIPGAVTIPVEEIEERYGELPADGRKTLVYCAGGVRSVYACEFLTSKGYQNLYNLETGMGSWSGPVEKPRTG